MKSLFLVLCLITCSMAHVIAQTPQVVTIYSDDFAGNQLELPPGKYDYMYLVRGGNAVVRSIKIPAGLRAILFERDRFEGGSIVLTGNTSQSQLEAKGFGKIAMNVSIVIERVPVTETPAAGTFVTIYKDDLSGASVNLVAGRYDVADLGDVGNDQLSSVRIPKGMKVTLYEHGSFKGRTLTFTADVRAGVLKSKSFNDVVSGIVVEQLTTESLPPKDPPVVAPVVPTTAPVTVPAAEPVIEQPKEPIIYQGDFSGASKSLPPGRYGKDNLGIANDELSSIKVPAGFRVTLYEGDAFEGRLMVLTGDARAASLAENNFNNVTSSIWVEALKMVTVYEGDYGGVSARLLPGRYAGHDFGIGNDQLSSIRVPEGLRVVLYENENFGGRSLSLMQDSGTDLLTSKSFNNEVSSMIVEELIKTVEQPTPVASGPTATIYTDRFSGRSQKLAAGSYRLADLVIGNDQLTSLIVPPGLRVILYEDDNFLGYSLTVTEDIDLSASNVFNNRTSSIVVEEVVLPVAPVQLPSDPAPTVNPGTVTTAGQETACEMTTTQFENAYKTIESKRFMDEMMAAARLTTKGRCLSLLQIRSISKLFMSDDQALEFVKYAFDLSSDQEEYYLLEDVFRFTSTRTAFTNFLNSKK